MKITEVIKKCQAEAQKAWEQNAMPGPKEGFVCGLATGHDSCANMLEETVREIRKELANLEQDYKNIEIGQIPCGKAMSSAMIVVLKWVLGKEDEK